MMSPVICHRVDGLIEAVNSRPCGENLSHASDHNFRKELQ